MSDNDATGSQPQGEDTGQSRPEEPEEREERDSSQPADDPGYLTQTGETVGDDGSVVPIIGGLPAVEGSNWDIGAAADERGAGLAEELDSSPDHDHRDTRGS